MAAEKRRAIIFDFDGTIADSFLTALDVLYELTHRDEPLPKEDISRLRGLTTRGVLHELGIPPWNVPFLAIRARRALAGRLSEIPLIPGIDKAIKKLSKRYTLFVLSSNSRENVRAFLERFAMADCFQDVYGSASPLWKQRKIKQLLRENDLVASTTWYIGDETRDVQAAHSVGLNMAAVTWGYNNLHALKGQNPEALIFTPDELVRCFENNGHPKKA
jgi:phosphoglycolate phosphatase-like HAD superfamily hydrolase